MRGRCLLSMLIVVSLLLLIGGGRQVYSSSRSDNPYESRIIELYKRIYLLGKEDIYVKDLIRDLNRVLAYIDEGDLDAASNLLDDIEARVDRLEARSGDILFWMNFRKYSVAAALISLPILAYVFIPRIYLEAWYRLRRRWRVRR